MMAHRIRWAALPGAVYFLDTCFLTDHDIPEVFWDALRTRRVAITPGILHELRGWISSPSCNQCFHKDVVAALRRESRCVDLIQPVFFDFNMRETVTYYTRLLGLRKHYPCMVRKTFEELGEPFTDEDVERVCRKDLQDRGWRMAKKAMADYGKPNLLADEELVAWAILYAIATGRETTILTRDSDVMEQFYKAIYLLDTHYRGMLIADHYSLHPWTFEHRTLSDEERRWMSMAFRGDDDTLIRLPRDYESTLLPPTVLSVMVYCWLFRGRPPEIHIDGLTFGAETAMARLLDVKAITRGLNTNLLQGRNCHVCVAPKHQHIYGGWGIISDDVQQEWQGTKISVADMDLSILRIENVSHVAVTPLHLPPTAF